VPYSGAGQHREVSALLAAAAKRDENRSSVHAQLARSRIDEPQLARVGSSCSAGRGRRRRSLVPTGDLEQRAARHGRGSPNDDDERTLAGGFPV
jgi:hypothetical protein